MVQNSMTRFEDRRICEQVLKELNISSLEGLLAEELERKHSLKIRKHKDNKSQEILEKELSKLAKEVVVEVHQFLGVTKYPEPIIKYHPFLDRVLGDTTSDIIIRGVVYSLSLTQTAIGLITGDLSQVILGFAAGLMVGIPSIILTSPPGYYDVRHKKIYIACEDTRRTRIVNTIAHEYTHYLQHQTQPNFYNRNARCNIVLEGHAFGVQRYIAERYAEREGNSGFLVDDMEQSIASLQKIYRWICDVKDYKTQKELLPKNSETNIFEIISKTVLGRPCAHSIGSILFLVLEREHGKTIYRDFVQGKYDFLEIFCGKSS